MEKENLNKDTDLDEKKEEDALESSQESSLKFSVSAEIKEQAESIIDENKIETNSDKDLSSEKELNEEPLDSPIKDKTITENIKGANKNNVRDLIKPYFLLSIILSYPNS